MDIKLSNAEALVLLKFLVNEGAETSTNYDIRQLVVRVETAILNELAKVPDPLGNIAYLDVPNMPELDYNEKALCKAGSPISAIKSYRARFPGCGLKQAKDKVDEYRQREGLIVDYRSYDNGSGGGPR